MVGEVWRAGSGEEAAVVDARGVVEQACAMRSEASRSRSRCVCRRRAECEIERVTGAGSHERRLLRLVVLAVVELQAAQVERLTRHLLASPQHVEQLRVEASLHGRRGGCSRRLALLIVRRGRVVACQLVGDALLTVYVQAKELPLQLDELVAGRVRLESATHRLVQLVARRRRRRHGHVLFVANVAAHICTRVANASGHTPMLVQRVEDVARRQT